MDRICTACCIGFIAVVVAVWLTLITVVSVRIKCKGGEER